MIAVKELIKKILKESEFDWADIDPSTLHKPYVGMKFRTKNDPNSVYEIFDLSGSIVYYKYISTETGREVKSSIPTTYFNRYMKDGDWVTHYVNEDFDWISHADETPNYQGHPQGVVYLRTHDEIKEFFNLLSTYGVAGKRNHDAIVTQKGFHDSLEDARDRYESDDWSGKVDWTPTISASFFVSKKDPTKYDTGYWDYETDKSSVEDWLDTEGCEHEVIDCENWKIYDDISQIRGLFNDYTGEVLHKTKSGKPIKVGDKVRVIDPDVQYYGEVLNVTHLVGGDGYEKHGGAFQTMEYDTLYFAGHEVEHVEDVNENFDWISNIEPNVVELLKSKLKGSEFYIELVDDGRIIEINDSDGGTYVDGYLSDENVYIKIINTVKKDSEYCPDCPPGIQDEYKRLYDLLKDNLK